MENSQDQEELQHCLSREAYKVLHCAALLYVNIIETRLL